MPHALMPLIKRLADIHLSAVGCYAGSGGCSLFSVSPSEGWKPNGSTFFPPGKHREYVIVAYWKMTNNYFSARHSRVVNSSREEVKVDLSMMLSWFLPSWGIWFWREGESACFLCDHIPVWSVIQSEMVQKNDDGKRFKGGRDELSLE